MECAVDRRRRRVTLMAPDLPPAGMCSFTPTAATLPGAPVYSTLNQAVTQVGTTFTVNLTPAAVLPAGTYWIEIQANMTFNPRTASGGWTDTHCAVQQALTGLAEPGRAASASVPHLGAKAGGLRTYRKRARPGVPDQRNHEAAAVRRRPTATASPTPTATASCTPSYTFTSGQERSCRE